MGKAKGPRKKSTDKLEDLGNLLERFQKSMDNLDKIDELEKVLDPQGDVGVINREFKLDTDKIESLEDVKLVFKAMDMSIYWYSEDTPEKFKPLLEKGLIKEITNENI